MTGKELHQEHLGAIKQKSIILVAMYLPILPSFIKIIRYEILLPLFKEIGNKQKKKITQVCQLKK